MDLSPSLGTRVKEEVFSCFVPSDNLVVRYLKDRGAFREDVNTECTKFGQPNSKANLVNLCALFEEERKTIMTELNHGRTLVLTNF